MVSNARFSAFALKLVDPTRTVLDWNPREVELHAIPGFPASHWKAACPTARKTTLQEQLDAIDCGSHGSSSLSSKAPEASVYSSLPAGLDAGSKASKSGDGGSDVASEETRGSFVESSKGGAPSTKTPPMSPIDHIVDPGIF